MRKRENPDRRDDQGEARKTAGEKHKPQLCISGIKAAGMAEGDAAIKASEIREPGGAGFLEKIKTLYSEMIRQNPKQKVRVMFQNEAGFGRINMPKSCWCRKSRHVLWTSGEHVR